MAEEYMNLKEAAEYLGISKGKMIRLVKEKTVKTYESPLDKRVSLVLKADVEQLKKPRATA